jgi:hypothetical protein
MSQRIPVLLLCVASVGSLESASAQVTITMGGGGAVLESYRFASPAAAGLEALSLLTVPLAFQAQLGRTVSMDFVGTYARGALRRADGSEAVLSGLTDTQLALTAEVVPELLSLGVVALLPTGKQKQTEVEADVAAAISADLLPFRISSWSTGGGIGVSGSLTRSLGRVGIGVSASYVLGREFDLLESGFAYRPGNQLVVRAAVDASVGQAGKLALQLGVQRASEDRANGNNLFRPGNRFLGMSSYSFRAGAAGSAIVYAGFYHRSAGSYLLEASLDAPTEGLWLAGGGMRIPLGGVVLQPSLDLRVLNRGDGTDQGYGLGAGTTLEWRRAGGITWVPLVRARFGNMLVREGVESGFTGFDAGLLVRFGSRQ